MRWHEGRADDIYSSSLQTYIVKKIKNKFILCEINYKGKNIFCFIFSRFNLSLNFFNRYFSLFYFEKEI